jgi:hypothetical protein
MLVTARRWVGGISRYKYGDSPLRFLYCSVILSYSSSCSELASLYYRCPPWPSLALRTLRMFDRCAPVASCLGASTKHCLPRAFAKRPCCRHQLGNDPRIRVLADSHNNGFLVPASKERYPSQVLRARTQKLAATTIQQVSTSS